MNDLGSVTGSLTGSVVTASLEADTRKVTIQGYISLPSLKFKTANEAALEAQLDESKKRIIELQGVVQRHHSKLVHKEKETKEDEKFEEKLQRTIDFLSNDRNDTRLIGAVD